jgi:hypothetical protein
VGIVVAVLAVVGGVVAVASGSGSDGASPAPSSTTATTRPVATTAPTPIATAAPSTTADPLFADPATDPRVLLLDVPAGFVPASVGTSPAADGAVDALNRQLFSLPTSTWSAGPWVLVDASASAVQFTRPTTTTNVNGTAATVGRSLPGDESVVVGTGAGAYSVTTKGLPAGSAIAIAGAVATAVHVGAGSSADLTSSIPASALPAGMAPFPGDLDLWLGGPGTAGSAWVTYTAPDASGFNVYSTITGEGADPVDDGAFLLDDLAYLIVDGARAVAGTSTYAGQTTQVVIEEVDGRTLVLSGVDADRDALVRAAASAVFPSDPNWSDDGWAALSDHEDPSPQIDQATVERGLTVGDDAHARVWAAKVGDRYVWTVDAIGTYIGRQTATELPMLQLAASTVWPTDPDGTFHVAAIAVGDGSLAGASLHLTVGTAGQQVVVPLHAIDDSADFDGDVGAAVVIPWPDGGVTAELIAGDGTVLATTTDADLP